MTTTDAFRRNAWTRQNPRLPNDWPALAPDWHCDHALRTDYARDQALVEIDILAAKALGLTLDELQTIYCAQLPIMRQHEARTYYDTIGRIASTPPEGLPAIRLPGKAIKGGASCSLAASKGVKDGICFGWEDIRRIKSATVACTLGQVALPEDKIMYLAPFGYSGRKEDCQADWQASTVGN